jgi:hypothetical protein
LRAPHHRHFRHQIIERYFQRVRELAQRSNVAAFAADLNLGKIALRDAGCGLQTRQEFAGKPIVVGLTGTQLQQ